MEHSSPPTEPHLDDFEEDPRYRIAQRESLLCIGYFVTFCGLSILIAWMLGSRDPSEVSFIAGFPDWFFWSAIALTVVFSTAVPYLMVKFGFTDLDLEPRPGQFNDDHTQEES
jgi:uncharacterized membrane protein YhdT